MPLSTDFSFTSTFDDMLKAAYLISYKESPLLQLMRFLVFFNHLRVLDVALVPEPGTKDISTSLSVPVSTETLPLPQTS